MAMWSDRDDDDDLPADPPQPGFLLVVLIFGLFIMAVAGLAAYASWP